MNQKDYKAIGEIITAYLCKYTCRKNDKIRKLRDGILTELADYFEKEDKEDLARTEERFRYHKKRNEGFNREQFLKGCGVK